MLSVEDNDLICRIGPGTLMGNLMRQYWIPGLLSNELPAPDCPPVRIMLLGEKLIAFRDTSGKVGLMQNACPHRGASMFFGRNEEDGLRCVYHGWKFDTAGNCVDMPSEPAESNFKTKVRARAYPTVERNGAVWVYMGPQAVPPPLPDIEANMAAGYHTLAMEHDHNWLQVLEGTIDTIHAGFLHSGAQRWQDAKEGSFQQAMLRERSARFETIDIEAGVTYGAHRPADPGTEYWRIATFLFPFYGISPTGGSFQRGIPTTLTAAVPQDDAHTIYFHFISQEAMPRYNLLPNGTGWYDRFNCPENSSNDYLIDRELQARGQFNSGVGNYTGIANGRHQDRAMTASMGHIYDRTHEHLGQTDLGIIRTRRRLLEAAKKFAADGTLPPGVNSPAAYRVRTGEIFLPEGADWADETVELRKAPIENAPIATTV